MSHLCIIMAALVLCTQLRTVPNFTTWTKLSLQLCNNAGQVKNCTQPGGAQFLAWNWIIIYSTSKTSKRTFIIKQIWCVCRDTQLNTSVPLPEVNRMTEMEVTPRKGLSVNHISNCISQCQLSFISTMPSLLWNNIYTLSATSHAVTLTLLSISTTID